MSPLRPSEAPHDVRAALAVKIEVAADVGVAALLDADDGWLASHGLPSATTKNAVVALGASPASVSGRACGN
jgi:hypothetical protein